MTTFDTIRSEGGLLPPDLLARIALLDKDVPGLKPADYRLAEGERFSEAISRSWARLLAAWRSFQTELAKVPEDDPVTTVTRERFLQPLLVELGFGRVATAPAIVVDDRSYAISHAWGSVPVHLLGARVSLEKKQAGLAGAARSSPHGLVQDLLNRSEPHLWALLSNGLVLRLLRDHHSLTTQAYVEIDLEAMFEEQRYADFVVLWLVCHQSRFDAPKLADCWLERWFGLSRDEGVRALDDLRDGVERAIEALGVGFLRHPHNTALVRDLAEGTLDKQDYYRELLRLVYRLIFLFSAEDRDVLLDPKAPELAHRRYQRFYATRQLRELAGDLRGGPHGDLWVRLRVVMSALDEGSPALGLPALGSFLWSREALPHLGGASISNGDLLGALRALSYLERDHQRFPIAWRTVAADELGSIYEGLLELHPRLDAHAGTFELNTAAGNERKKTGSYYTPTALVDCLLDSALDPVIYAAVAGKKRDEAEQALLALKVVDPACGSGHFLVAAARRMARRLASVRTGDDEPSPPELRQALRDVVGRCIYGVDLNEMAVELCKVALWMEAVEPGKPLSFLDAHIQHGNALIGATPALIASGIPDEAWDPIEGDDKAVARALKKRNREGRKQAQGTMWDALAAPGAADLASAARDALGGDDDALADVRARKRRWEILRNSPSFVESTRVADAWCAAFVWPKQEGTHAAEAPTEETFARVRATPSTASNALRAEVNRLALQYMFFHWHLAFPDVFTPRAATTDGDDITGWDGGFDCVLGNPPWERVKLQEKEFFAGRHEEITRAENAALRKRLIAKLPTTDPALWTAWTLALRHAEGESHWVRNGGRYPLCGQGDINTYALFAELNRSLMSDGGRVGCIVPAGIASDDTTKEFFSSLVTRNQLVSLYHFENEEFVFPTVHHSFRFCLLTLAHRLPTDYATDMLFFARQVTSLGDPERHISLSATDFARLNPNTRTCPTFRSRRDADINKRIYHRLPVLWCEDENHPDNPWGVKLRTRIWHMAEDAEHFRTSEDLQGAGSVLRGNRFMNGSDVMLPLYEAKMVHLFDHRFSTYEGQSHAQANQGKCPEFADIDHEDPQRLPLPYYWVNEREVEARFADLWDRPWIIGWRDICRSSDIRTVIAAAIPRVACGDTFLLMFPVNSEIQLAGCLLANLCSLVFDYIARQKVGGTHLKCNVMKQLPIVPPSQLRAPAAWDRAPLAEWLTSRSVELVYTAVDMAGFANDCGHGGPPFRWNTGRRALLRAELDAAFLHVYGVSRADAEHILESFPVLRTKEEREHGEYRTKRLVLERYDALSAAVAAGRPYESPLDPPPGDPRAAHSMEAQQTSRAKKRG